MLASIPVPLDTKDFVPYLAQIPADTEVLLPAGSKYEVKIKVGDKVSGGSSVLLRFGEN